MESWLRPLVFTAIMMGWARGPALAAADEASSNGEAGTAAGATRREENGRIATLDVADLKDYRSQSPAVQNLLARALALTKLNLGYHYGSSDPASGGMDCSGTIYYLLRRAGVKDAPRDSAEMYRWVWTEGHFQAVVSSNPQTFELARLKPGDLLFWTGTYRVERDPPVTHVMIYLGINRRTGQPAMVGASEGRRFNGVSRFGVSVFDFVLPKHGQAAGGDEPALESRFIGYGAIPGLEQTAKAADEAGEVTQ